MYSLRAAANKAQEWLESSASEPRDPLTDFGLWLCTRIHRPSVSGAVELASEPVDLPAPSTLVENDRIEILALAQAVTLSDRSAWRRQMRDPKAWAHILGGIALSHARDGDLVVVAAVLRMAACLCLHGPWLTAALRHVLDQQQPDGSFGLLAPELAVSEDPNCQPQVTLRLTVEVLWALAEVSAARGRVRDGSGGEVVRGGRRSEIEQSVPPRGQRL